MSLSLPLHEAPILLLLVLPFGELSMLTIRPEAMIMGKLSLLIIDLLIFGAGIKPRVTHTHTGQLLYLSCLWTLTLMCHQGHRTYLQATTAVRWAALNPLLHLFRVSDPQRPHLDLPFQCGTRRTLWGTR